MPEVKFSVPGRVALITGGGSGIGRAIAHAFSGIGIDVGIADKDPARVAAAEAALQNHGVRSCAVVADVGRADDAKRVVSEVDDKLGTVDILVNCAGIFPRSSVAEMTEEEWDQALGTNLKSVFLMSQAVVKQMMSRKQGRIITITSGLGVTGSPRGSHYSASKGGINGFTRSLAKEVANDGINVNAIAPGLTDTPMMRGANTPEYIASVTSSMPGGKLGNPEDVVGLALFLVSEGARHITGQVIALRG